MGQSNYIAAAIALAFIVYITMKGSLSKYISILTGGGGFAQDTASAGNTPTQTAQANTSASQSSATASNSSGQSSSSGSNASDTAANATAPLSILQQVTAAGGPADALLDGVKMFGAGASFLGV
jgi:guanyl-specific ribonuclease Sa